MFYNILNIKMTSYSSYHILCHILNMARTDTFQYIHSEGMMRDSEEV